MAVEHKKKEEAAATVAPRQEDDKIESTFSEVPQESDVLGAAGGDAAGERPATRPGRLAGTKRRVSRKAVTMAMPKPVLPEWFLERGVVLKEEKVPVRLGLYSDTSVVAAKATATDATIIETATIEATTIETTPTEEVAKEAEAAVPAAEEPTKEDQPADEVKEEAVVAEVVKKEEATTAEEPVAKERYQLHESVWKEITTNIRTGLLLPKGAFADSLASTKSHYLLHLPKEGGLYFLDAATEKLAEEVGADLIRIDVQDFSEIAGDYLGDSQHGECPF